MSEETTQRPRYRIVVRSLPGVVDYADNPHDAALIAVNLAKDARGHTARAFATIFLITYQAHLATAGRRKLGFRRPRNHVSGRLAVDSRSPTSSRGRLRFVSAAQMSLVRNQDDLWTEREGSFRCFPTRSSKRSRT